MTLSTHIFSDKNTMPRKKKVPEPGTRRYGSKSIYTLAVLEEYIENVRTFETEQFEPAYRPKQFIRYV